MRQRRTIWRLVSPSDDDRTLRCPRRGRLGRPGSAPPWHLHMQCPRKRYVILEGRPAIGGTWDLFRYPGVRSDSDMHTLGYGFKPSREAKAIADGPSILAYIEETAAEGPGLSTRPPRWR